MRDVYNKSKDFIFEEEKQKDLFNFLEELEQTKINEILYFNLELNLIENHISIILEYLNKENDVINELIVI
jgi:hypothetical protein